MTSRSEQRADSDIQVVIHKAGPSPAGQGELIPHWQTHLCVVWIYKKYLHLTNIIGLGWIVLEGQSVNVKLNSQEGRMPGRNGFLVPAAIQ